VRAALDDLAGLAHQHLIVAAISAASATQRFRRTNR
jgi:hypothetical protein